MSKEQICYFCKHICSTSAFSCGHKCEKTGKAVETYDSCSEWKDYEEE